MVSWVKYVSNTVVLFQERKFYYNNCHKQRDSQTVQFLAKALKEKPSHE